MKSLIIEKPRLAPLSNRVGWAFFTTFFWLLWFYLWTPLITLFLWWLGVHLFDHFVLQVSLDELRKEEELVLFYFFFIVIAGAVLVGWAGAEYARFHNSHRRHKPSAVKSGELASWMQISNEYMAELSSARRMVVHCDEHGKFLSAELGT